MSLLEVNHLSKFFFTPKGKLHAVEDVSFCLDSGKTMGVVGESGCGKSTLGRTLLRLIEPQDGQILFDGEDILSYNKAQLKRMRMDMQMIFQDPFASLNPRMSVSEIIAEPFHIFPELVKNKSEIQLRVEELMDTVGLARRLASSYPHELDGGRRQRIGIAKALAMDPKFIVCDEPVSALDVSIQAQILNLLQDLQKEKGMAYLFITHDLSVVKHISDEIIVMYLGQIVEKAPTKELFRTTLHPYTEALLSAIPRPTIHRTDKRIILKGEVKTPIDPAPGCRFASRCPYARPECSACDPELKEVTPGHLVACSRVHEIRDIQEAL